ncbi:glycosyltransferase family 2 protein [Candidatus Parcubacteria bacterium]|nr:glycosyltransferase family 2 protein [Patescibacteria group bacterium]MBU4467065.1 glycosyltransferase family 2 protein [Patescibacteria group bacterium]MCG2688311.1 glycosyltransferase family 2 protein [Candidatus Parcubacteria bacterium]
MAKKLISIIIPVYNEEKNLRDFFNSLSKTLKLLSPQYSFEAIFVNDGSTDNSAEILKVLKVRQIELSRNFGKEIALSCGIHHAKGEAVISIDADLQHPIELIPSFIEKWQKGADIVIGIRQKRAGEGIIRRWGSYCFYKIMDLISETKLVSGETDFRLISRQVADEFNRFTERGRIARGLIDWLGFKRDYIYFKTRPRQLGKPSYSFAKLVRLGLSGFVTHSLVPLKLAGYLGIIITIFSGLLGSFMFINKFIFGDPWDLAFSNVTMLAVFITFLIGIVLICLGLIALYVANIHLEVTNRPIYVIRKKENLD